VKDDPTKENKLPLSVSLTQNLTDWKKEPTLEQLKADWEGARNAHNSQIAKIEKWDDLLKTNRRNPPKKRIGRSRVQPKLIRRQAEWRYSALSEPFLGSEKLFKITPATFADINAADQNELVINHQFRTKLNRVKFIDDYVRSTVDEGTCVLQIGWERATKDEMVDSPVYQYTLMQDPQELQEFQQNVQMKVEDNRDYENLPPEVQAAVDYFEETQKPTTAKQIRTEKVKTTEILVNRPTVMVMNPKNVFIDPTCLGDIDKALFVAVSFETNKADLVKQGKRYKNLEDIDWEGATVATNPDHATTTPIAFTAVDSSRKKVVAYEYWGFFPINDDDVLVPFVASWIGNVLIRMELNPFPDQRLPFVLVTYMPVKRELYGEPDAELLEDNQAILGAITRGMIDLLGRSANGQQGFAKGMLDPLNRRRFDNGQDYEFNPNTNPQQGMIEHKYPEIPASAMNMLTMQNQEAEALTGVKSFGTGITGQAFGDVAAGAKGALDAAAKREMSILRRLAKGMSEVGRKIIAMNQVFMSDEETIRITNEKFVKIRRKDIQGEFDLIVDISTAEIDNAQAENLSFMLQTVGPNADPALVKMILIQIAKLKRMPDLAQEIKNYQPQPDPHQQQMQQLELAKAQKEIDFIQSQIDLNKAKADESEASSEAKQINTAHIATGQKHDEAMEQQTAQSQGNQDLAVTKALLHPRKPDQSAPEIEAAIGYNKMSREIDDAGPGPSPQDQTGGAQPPIPGQMGGDPASLQQDPSLGGQDPTQSPDSVDSSQQSSDQDPSGVGGAPSIPGGQPPPGISPNPGPPQ
jgi:hypothetical protein